MRSPPTTGVRLATSAAWRALNLAARDATVAARSPRRWRLRRQPDLYALAESALTRAGSSIGLRVAHEVFAERRYEADATLTPRTLEGAVIEDLDEALAQVRSLLRDGIAVARSGELVPLRADTLCLHGDRKDAAVFARALHEALRAEGFHISAPGQGQ